MLRRSVASALVVALLLLPHTGRAWGQSGHRIVARIAAKNLTPPTRQKVRAILGVSDAGLESSMATAAVWPDRIDRKSTGTNNWHFVNVPAFAPFSLSGLCAGNDCVVNQIQDMSRRLRTNQSGFTLKSKPVPPRPMTSQELSFLIHFVGDIHQPLHAIVNGDLGGGCVGLTTDLGSGPSAVTNLHGVWDDSEVQTVMRLHGNSEAQTATALFQRFTKGATVTQAEAADWARESHAIARSAIYQALNIPPRSAATGQCAKGIQDVSVSQGYLDSNVATVESRLMEAGIRLSRLLNDICAGAGCKPAP